MHFKSCVAALLVVSAGALAFAQTKVTTPDELDKAMKKVGPALQAANKALASGAPAEASKQLAIIKQAIIDSREFWVTHKKDDAIEANKLTVEKIEAVEKMLAAPRPGRAGGAGGAQAGCRRRPAGSATRSTACATPRTTGS